MKGKPPRSAPKPSGNGRQPAGAVLPPHDADAELATLGSILLDAEIALPQITAILKPSDYFIDRHRWVYMAALALRDRGEPVDFVTLTSELEARGQLSEVGGPAFIAGLDKAALTAYHAEGYARIVSKRTVQREWLNWASEVASEVYGDDFDPDVLAATTRLTLEALRRDGRRDPWTFRTLADAYAPREPLQHVVGGLYALPSLNVVYGAPGSLKSFFLADTAVCVAGGLPWLSPLPDDHEVRPKNTIQSPVLWLDFDNGTRRTDERFGALGRAYNLPGDLPLHYISMPSPWLDASNRDAVSNLADRITARGAQLVVVDNLGVVAGDAEENSADMAGVMANLRWLSEQTGAAIVCVHHQRKAPGFTGRAGESLRGHSSIEAALDLALLIEREERSSLIKVRSTKTRDVDVIPFGAQFAYEHKGGTSELERARFFGAAVEDTDSDAAIERAIMDALSARHPMNQTRLVACVKESIDAGRDRIRHIAECLVGDGKLRSTSGARGAKDYDLS